MAQKLDGLRALSGRYRGILCDVWGVLHNGVDVYPDAGRALEQFREDGGTVVMITNSPRPRAGVIAQLQAMGVNQNAFDAIVTSGDVTRELIAAHEGPFFHIGPERDLPLFDGLNVDLVIAEEASAVVCSGFFDEDNETPQQYADVFAELIERGLPMICANPDLVVERGHELIWCAGSLAKLYAEMGGTVRIAGKPHHPIYDLAHRMLDEISGEKLNKQNIVAIGDGLPTDVAGAKAYDVPMLYISGGIHSAEYGEAKTPDEKRLQSFLKANNADPRYWLSDLNW